MNYFPPNNTKVYWPEPNRSQRYAYYKGWWLYVSDRDGIWRASIWQAVYGGIKNQKRRSRFKNESTAIAWCERQVIKISHN